MKNTLSIFTNLVPELSKILLTIYDTEIFSTLTHQIFNMYITLKLKGNVVRMVFLEIFHMAGIKHSDIKGECIVQLYWVNE
jgi:hypothetical protein